jgi:hypothetical protein
MRRWSLPALLVLAGIVSSSACTFGANDYKLLPARDDSGGSGGSATDEGGAAGSSAGCTNHTPTPLLVMSPDDLHQATVDRFTLIPGSTEVFAIAFVTVTTGAVPQTHAIIRTITDANFGTARGIADMPMPGAFMFGGAWATATEIDIVGADARGIVQLTIPVNAMGNADLSSAANVVVTPLDTPIECAQNVRALRVVKSPTGAPAFVASCQPDATNPNNVSLWLSTPALTKTTLVAAASTSTDNLVRSFVRNGPSGATSNLVMVGADETPSSDFRTGSSPLDLKTVSALTMSNDPGWLQQVLTEGQPDADGGAFLMVTKFHDPKTSVTPAEVWAGQVASDAYSSLTAVPPTQLKLVTSYSSTADVFVPQEWTVRGTTVDVAVADQFVQQNLALWTLDETGGPPSISYPFYSSASTGNTLTDERIAQLTLADVIAWVETSASAGTAVYASSISCF